MDNTRVEANEINRVQNIAGVVEDALRAVDLESLNRVIDSLAHPVFVKNQRLEWILVNASFCDIFGHTREELLGRTEADFLPPEQAAVVNKIDRKVIASGRPAINEKAFTSAATGETHTIRTTKTTFVDNDGNAVLVGIGTDLTALRETQRCLELANEKLRDLALNDELTGLPNRRAFREELDRTVDLSRRHDTQFAVLLLNLNGFKSINDTYGHDVGDEVLSEVAARMRIVARSSDFLVRLAGDEFAMIAKNTDGDGAAIIAQRMAMELARAMLVSCGEVQSGASIGIACYPNDGIYRAQLVRNADEAVYYAKHVTLEPVVMFSEIPAGDPEDPFNGPDIRAVAGYSLDAT